MREFVNTTLFSLFFGGVNLPQRSRIRLSSTSIDRLEEVVGQIRGIVEKTGVKMAGRFEV
jgi:hypothetical protein